MESSEGLREVLERADAALHRAGPLPASARAALAGSLLERQIRTGRGAGLFLLSPSDWERGPRLWTGEPIRTKLAAAHVFSQEAARLLLRLGGDDPTIERAVAAAAARLAGTCYAVQHCTIGECATSFVGYLRLLAAIPGEGAQAEIAARVQTLSQHRLGDGRWRRCPLFYTVLVLSELRLPAAEDELLYAREACLRAARHNAVEEPYSARRAWLLCAVCGEERSGGGVSQAARRAVASAPAKVGGRRPPRG